MTFPYVRENEAGALALADDLTAWGNRLQAEGRHDLARRAYNANAKARALAAELAALGKENG